ncbi:MAG: IPExxxVDY family protein [Bacteroidales bacterium]
MAKKRKLHTTFTPEFSVIGLFSAQKDYRLCWLINNHLHIGLKRLPDFQPVKEEPPSSGKFSVYACHDPKIMTSHYLVSNKSTEDLLVDVSPAPDFLMLVQQGEEPVDTETFNTLISSLRAIPMIDAAYSFDEKLAQKAGAFLYDFEMFLTKADRP